MGCDVQSSMTNFAHTNGCTHTLEARTYVGGQIFIQGPRTQIPETDGGQDLHSQPHKATKDQTLVSHVTVPAHCASALLPLA